jgi:deoxyribodipyrimidine photo-lyase
MNEVTQVANQNKKRTMTFPTDYASILQRLEKIDPVKYARTRNFTDGDVTYLSPYISRGVISLRQVAARVLKTHKPYQIEKFLQELAWREYWQRVWQSIGDKIFTDIKQEQQDVAHRKMVAAIENADTGIEAIDEHIELLYQSGYMHNHLRMYISSIACNIAKTHWLQPSKWMYYHLLDGDLASNSLSWQWTACAFSSKKYYCNQENINKYTNNHQVRTFLDCSYEELTNLPIPQTLLDKSNFFPVMDLPKTPAPIIQQGIPVLVYNAYNLDPLWYSDEPANRILLLEPSHYKKYPVSDKVLQFILDLSKNIEGIQVFTGEFDELRQLANTNEFIYKSHPAFIHYTGIAEQYDDLFPQVKGYFSSFFSYWKKCEKYLHQI